MFKDPADIFVIGVLIAFVALIIVAKISSDKADVEEKMPKEERSGDGKKKRY